MKEETGSARRVERESRATVVDGGAVPLIAECSVVRRDRDHGESIMLAGQELYILGLDHDIGSPSLAVNL